ncbi:Rha family transcriptional regulator [Endozoicomonas sp. SESOKO4]|uniref:Rha family transcriptional regulator n=1 Tax=Endozoicomonas sp. SESOKO4 TaxID=2828745 RepID=UPI0021496860|nr:Rha family transcriptional regulator [Endozoicomonas sp. SESOKO4]
MSHIEIAKLAGKRPDSVKRTMDSLRDKGLITFTQIEETFVGADGKNQKRNTYHVNQRDSYVVMAQVSPEFTAKLVDRWQELEKEKAQQQQQAIPTSTGNPVLDALIQTLV